MTRRIITLSIVSAVVFTCLITDAFAGCGGGSCYRPTYRRAYHHTYVRPVVNLVHQAPPVIVAPPQRRPNFPTVPSGSTITIPANFLGAQPGSVFMVFNNIKLPVQINNWTQTGVTVTLPPMAIKEAVLIRLDIILPHGQLGNTQKILVTAPAPVILHPTAPTSPLPTNAALQVQAG